MERFLPIYARKRNFSPKTYDSYRQNLETHIYPYFGLGHEHYYEQRY